MIYSTNVPASKVKAIQELIGAFGLHFDTNPYPLLSNSPEGKWRVSINYSNCSSEKKKSFDDALSRLIKPIKETDRKSVV